MPSLSDGRRWLASIATSSDPNAAVASLVRAELERLGRAEQAVLLAVEQASEPVWIPGEFLRRAFRDVEQSSSQAECVGGEGC